MKCFNIFAYIKSITSKMPSLIITSKYFINSLNFKILFLLSILIIYFTWMDIALFVNLQKWTPSYNDEAITLENVYKKPNSITITSIEKKPQNADVGIFNPLSVKLVMIDHMTHYVHDIVARFIENNLHLTDHFPWITPNLVSFTGLALALVASKLVLSEKLSHRRIACLLFELRNFADSLDGVVFRSISKREHTFESIRGTFGYNVDVICDGLGGLVFVLAIFFRLLKNPPHRCK